MNEKIQQSIPSIMRHTINVSGTSSIKNQRIQCKKLVNMQQQSIVKIEQNNKKIYAIYTPNPSTQYRLSEKSQISMKYLSLNNIEENLASLSKIQTPPKIKTIEIQLFEIDYRLVNNNFGLLESSFLDQVNIVWPEAKIPLYYDETNFVTLMPKVDGIYLVDPYAAISFNVKSQPVRQPENSRNYQEQIQLGDQVLVLERIDDEKMIKFGYENKIYVGHEEFEYLNKFKKNNQFSLFYCTVQSLTPFLENFTFEQFQQYKKLQASSKIPQIEPFLVQIIDQSSNNFKEWQGISPSTIHKHKLDQDFHQIGFSCTSVSKIMLGLSQKLMISDESINSFTVTDTLSFEMFTKQLNAEKYLIEIQVFDPNLLNATFETDLINNFAKSFVKLIAQERQFIFFQNYYPFIIDGTLYGLNLLKKVQNKTQYEKSKNFLMIKLCTQKTGNNSNQQRNDQYLFNKINLIKKHIKVNLCNQSLKITKLLPTIKTINEIKKDSRNNHKQKKFQRIFSSAYSKEVSEGIEWLKKQMSFSSSSRKILFSTYSSNGKTYLHSYLNKQRSKTSIRSWYLNCRDLVHPSNRFEDIMDYLTTFIILCPYKLIFFDNIETFLPLIQEGDQMRQKQKTIAHVFAKSLLELIDGHCKIAVFTSKSQANIDPMLKFDKIIKLKNPSRQIRSQIVKFMAVEQSHQWIEQFIDKTQSFSLGSFATYLIARQIPVKKKTKRKNDFSKIVGLEQAKKVINSVIEKPNKFGFIYEKVKIKVPRGILLYGATGNGKTALGSAVQDEFPMKFFSVKGSDILSKYIGGSEAAVRQVFQKALSVSPSIIFFDQFQSIVPRRNSSGTGVTDRVVNQFLCYLDGVSSTTGVFIIAASSRPDLIDPALLRPGRIDSHVYLQYPNQEQRYQLLQMFEESVKLEVNEEQFVKLTQNYSYSDLIGLLKELRIKKSSLVLKEKQNPTTDDFKSIHKELFYDTIKSYRIGTQLEEQTKQKELFQRFKFGKGPQIKKQKFIQM